MKRKKSLAVGILCGVACAACVGAYVMQVDDQAQAVRAEALERYGGEQIEVCVAKRDIAPGETLAESAVETKMWVAALLPEGAVTDRAQAVGKTTGTSILKGEVILTKRFAAQTASLDVPEGMVAVSVPARDVQAIGGALAAGMKADVYAIGSSSADRILTQAAVLATSATEADGSNGTADITWVTLAVAPAHVQEVISAAENLELYFVLPADSGTSTQDSAGSKDDPANDASDSESVSIDPEKLRARVLSQGNSSEEGAVTSTNADGKASSSSDGANGEDPAASSTRDGEEGSPWIR